MSAVDNIINELKVQSEAILKTIAETSYGVSTYALWETIGMVKSTTDTNLFMIEELKKELRIEQANAYVPKQGM